MKLVSAFFLVYFALMKAFLPKEILVTDKRGWTQIILYDEYKENKRNNRILQKAS